ncbi:thymidylate synthase [Patescibacteria group bacterium]|nr:thymidylate synthase [Patescibacteria group bacterium]MCL5010414.1 thymidylate synthase [Patescibacteria group bacterium]
MPFKKPNKDFASFNIVNKNIISDNMDELIVKDIKTIKLTGHPINVSNGTGIQTYGINYILLNSRNRLHYLRAPTSIRYFCRELIAYFKGSLNVEEGLAQASSFWRKIADKNGKINSNYGYYVFREKCPNNANQYRWAIQELIETKNSRRSIININQPKHKVITKDFPCTVSLQYFIRPDKNGNDFLCSDVSARSIDVVTGLPYDMGFFSFLTELVYADLIERGIYPHLKLGYTMLKTSFTQIYDRTSHLADQIAINSKSGGKSNNKMPKISSASQTLSDIFNFTRNSKIVKWIYDNSL